MPVKPRRITAGWREWAGLPDLGVTAIKVKVDTGARTSALHAVHVHRYTDATGPRVAFEIHPRQRGRGGTVACSAALVGDRLVTSSNGHREYRPVVRTALLLGGQRWLIDLTLTNRDSMGFRMLLGRAAMRRHMLVNPSASFICGPPEGESRESTLPESRSR